MLEVFVNCPYPLEKANPTDVGYDLKCHSEGCFTLEPNSHLMVPTGCKLKIETSPKNSRVWDIQLRGRSGLASKGILVHVGTIDQTYHEEIKVVMFNLSGKPYRISPGDKIAQLVFSQARELKTIPVTYIKSDRGGFGSSGK